VHECFSVAGMIADDLSLAGAVMACRDGRPVAMHYGSVGAELSICLKHVGIAERADLDALELTGDRDGFQDELGELLGHPAPAFGMATRIGGAHCGVIDPAHAIVVGPPAACRTFAARRSQLRCTNRSGAWEVFTLVGPRTRALLARAGLPPDLVEHGIRACWTGGGPAVLLHEADERHLLVVAAANAGTVWHDLAAAGRPLELGCVGFEALARLDAAASGPIREQQHA
jgi:glycine cleavage system aminomethyltransferase T